jgi:hypothetical protein
MGTVHILLRGSGGVAISPHSLFADAVGIPNNWVGDAVGVAIGITVVALILMILNYVAIFKIITKAGYSGWWILLPLMPVFASIASYVVLDKVTCSPLQPTCQVGSFDPTTTLVLLWILSGVSVFLSWIFFLVFAFSNWPVMRELRMQQSLNQTAQTPVAYSTAPGYAAPVQYSPPVPAQAVAPSFPTDIRCPYCGTTSPAGTTFCGTCGGNLIPRSSRSDATPAETVAPVPAVMADPGPSPAPVSVPVTPAVPIPTVGQFAMPPAPPTRCPNCFQSASPETAFCGTCGTKLGA